MNHFTNQFNGSHRGHSLMGRAMIRRFALFPMMLLMLLLLPAGMVAQKAASSSKYIATYDSDTETLTFKEYAGETLPSNSVWVEDKQTVADINKNLGNGTIVHIVFDKSFRTYTPTSLYSFFENLTNLETITGLEYLNTEKVTDMNRMFYSCKSLTSLDVTHFNTANVTDMNHMFSTCQYLSSLDVTNFNTEKVTNMAGMFYNCSSLTSLDVTHFNTANVTNMSFMFYYCSSLTTIYASSKFVTTQVSNSIEMFNYCEKLKGEEVWSTDKATDKTYAKIEGGYFCNMVRPWVKYADGTLTFYNSFKDTLGENEYKLNSGTNSPGWAKHIKEITKVVFDTSFANAKPTSCYYWFYRCEKLRQIEGIKNLNTEMVTNMSAMFAHCPGLSSLDVSSFNTEKVTDMSYMFYNCQNLVSLDVTNFNTANVTDMSDMFYWCSSLHSLDVTKFNTANVKSMANMFNLCHNLVSLDVTNFNTENVTSMQNMFGNNFGLSSLDVTNFNTKNVTNMTEMFQNCIALKTIYVGDKFVTDKVTDGSDMFLRCDKLKGANALDKNKPKTGFDNANYKTGYFTKLVGKNGDEKIGATGETLTADTLTLADDKDFVAYEPFTAKAASYSRTMSVGTTWATLCLPFEVSLQNQNFRAFKLLSADDAAETVELEEIKTSIAAGTPVIIKMKDGATKLNFSEADKEITNEVKIAETANSNYQLQGLYTQKVFSKDADNNCYIVKGDKLMNPAKLLGTSTEFVGSKPFRAYMVDNSSAPAAGARMFSIRLGDGTTAIKQLEADAADSKAEYYDLQGRRLQDLQKGINIVKRGGKTMKVIIK